MIAYHNSWRIETGPHPDCQATYRYALAGIRALWLDGCRSLDLKSMNGSGAREDTVKIELGPNADTIVGQVNISTEWGTVDVVGFWEGNDAGRLLLRMVLR